jgi:type III restriction enzyme
LPRNSSGLLSVTSEKGLRRSQFEGRTQELNQYEVPEPILNSPFDEPAQHWHLVEGEAPERRPGRRPAGYFFRDPRAPLSDGEHEARGQWQELTLVNLIRARVKAWREAGCPGASGLTLELLAYWRREGRRQRLFFAQLEAAEAVIFLTEARADFLQGISVPPDEPGEEGRAKGYTAFRRYACKMATGGGKTTVMGMLAAWSILNKLAHRSDARFSDAVLVVCPNVTIRSRLGELDPALGEASLYRTRDLVPGHLMPDLARGHVLITNWHVFEPQSMQTGGVSARVSRAGVPVRTLETIVIGEKTHTARGSRYLTPEDFDRQVAAGLLKVKKEIRDKEGHLRKAQVESLRYVESDTALLSRVLGRAVGGKQNLLVFNDEAHHAYRIRRAEPDEGEEEDEEAEEFFKEATVWIEGLDRIHKHRGINFCVDLSATPYYLGRVGQDTNRTFPWVVSDFGLTDAIESGLTKIPQLAVRDNTGADIPGYFNIWRWILPKLTPAERGGRKGAPKPEAILKYAHTPIAMLGGLWEASLGQKAEDRDDPRPPVFILVCKNTQIAKVVYEWLAEDRPPTGVPSSGIAGFLNRDGAVRTIRVDSKVVHETDTGEAKGDEARWMRLTLDTVGRLDWPRDRQGRALTPDGFGELAAKLGRPPHPPGRDVRCIVSVGMLTEGWDCNTVTHIVGLRPFMSQLLCEQVVGRGLRRMSYDIGADGKLSEEVAQVFGVPFEVIPFKQNPSGVRERVKRYHVHAIPQKAEFEIRFPRVEGYSQAVRNRVTVDWDSVATVELDPVRIPPQVEMKAGLPNNQGRHTLAGPGKLISVDLNPYRAGRRLQELVFDLARDLTRDYVAQTTCEAPAHVLFPQLQRIVERYLSEKVQPVAPAQILDVFLSPYYGWVIERLVEAIRPDASGGEIPETPRFEQRRGPGSTAEVDFWTAKEVHEVVKSHLNYVAVDSKLEARVLMALDQHAAVRGFAKNQGLGFAIPYLHNGQTHDYLPDFVVRLDGDGGSGRHLILETKGYDPLKEVKAEAARRWVNAVNAEGSFGHWGYAIAERPEEVPRILDTAAAA